MIGSNTSTFITLLVLDPSVGQCEAVLLPGGSGRDHAAHAEKSSHAGIER